MVTWQTVLNSLATIVPTSGLTGGAVLTVLLLLIRSGKLWLGTQHDAVVHEKDVQLEMMRNELDRTRDDRDAYRTAEGLQRDRSDAVQGKVMDTVVPTLAGVDHALTRLADEAAARTEAP